MALGSHSRRQGRNRDRMRKRDDGMGERGVGVREAGSHVRVADAGKRDHGGHDWDQGKDGEESILMMWR